MADPWFAGVTNWLVTLPTEAADSQRVYADLMKDRLPAAQLNQLLIRQEYVNRGIEMLHHLILHINPSHP